MALRLCWLLLFVVCCGVTNASDDEVQVCRGHCHSIATALIPDLSDNSTDTDESAESRHGNSKAVVPHTPSNRDLLLGLDVHTFCTVLCRRMDEDELTLVPCVPEEGHNDDSDDNDSESENEQEDRLRRRQLVRRRKMAAGRRGQHSKAARAARRRRTR
ncbi:uncharacterized protein LOC124796310 [Schistocerca piceifrons]|uniref:uncharacterized protein LOC124796310 n=1 Tax=Schistocerca piceifrons TaxID=274613 RepID=UPI001F5F4FE1|nr:uncharacterized protein LOC124796310 [Schistocerca piceifrons]